MSGLSRSYLIAHRTAAFRPYVHGRTVHFTAACWMIIALAPTGSEAEEADGHG